MGKLLQLLDDISQGIPKPFGFLAKERSIGRAFLFIATGVMSDPSFVQKLRDVQFDAVVLNPFDEKNESAGLKELHQRIAVGVRGDQLPLKNEKDVDFEIFSSDGTLAAALAQEDRTVVMELDPDLDDKVLRTIEDLPVDAFLVSLTEVENLNIQHLMRISRIHMYHSKHLLLELPILPSRDELRILKEIGVSGLVICAAEHAVKDLQALSAMLDQLPSKPLRKRSERPTGTIPSTYAELEEDFDGFDDFFL